MFGRNQDRNGSKHTAAHSSGVKTAHTSTLDDGTITDIKKVSHDTPNSSNTDIMPAAETATAPTSSTPIPSATSSPVESTDFEGGTTATTNTGATTDAFNADVAEIHTSRGTASDITDEHAPNSHIASTDAAVHADSAAATASAEAAKRGWKFRWYSLIPAILVVVGLLVLSYPTMASWFSQYDQSRLIETSTEQVHSGSLSPSVKQQLKEAHEYNDALSAGAVLEANHRIPTGSGTSDDPNETLDYNKILVDPVGVMARLRIPSIKADLPIYHGTSDATLLKGVGHLEGTSLPVGGKGTHAVLTGHRGLATATLFTNLDKVKKKDTFTIEVMGQTLTYRVFDIKVVDPEDTASLQADPDKDLVTLVTCTPLGINSQRILVTGERITPTPKADVSAAGQKPDIPGFPWWAVIQAAGVVLAGVFVWRSGYPPKPRKQRVK